LCNVRPKKVILIFGFFCGTGIAQKGNDRQGT
jgi:hypothetical protein